jgi:hypothetical protein
MRCNRDSAEDSEGKVKIMSYQVERSIRRMELLKDKDLNSKIVWIVDCNGFSYKNVDMKVYHILKFPISNSQSLEWLF